MIKHRMNSRHVFAHVKDEGKVRDIASALRRYILMDTETIMVGERKRVTVVWVCDANDAYKQAVKMLTKDNKRIKTWIWKAVQAVAENLIGEQNESKR